MQSHGPCGKTTSAGLWTAASSTATTAGRSGLPSKAGSKGLCAGLRPGRRWRRRLRRRRHLTCVDVDVDSDLYSLDLRRDHYLDRAMYEGEDEDMFRCVRGGRVAHEAGDLGVLVWCGVKKSVLGRSA